MRDIVGNATTILGIALLELFLAIPSSAIKPDRPNPAALSRQNMPTTGKVVKLTQGDLMCYVDLIDANGKQHNIGADFAICDRPEFLNKPVRLIYKRIRVNDCQSNQACGKTRLKNAIVKMTLVSPKSRSLR
jgi:hypothetical protein